MQRARERRRKVHFNRCVARDELGVDALSMSARRSQLARRPAALGNQRPNAATIVCDSFPEDQSLGAEALDEEAHQNFALILGGQHARELVVCIRSARCGTERGLRGLPSGLLVVRATNRQRESEHDERHRLHHGQVVLKRELQLALFAPDGTKGGENEVHGDANGDECRHLALDEELIVHLADAPAQGHSHQHDEHGKRLVAPKQHGMLRAAPRICSAVECIRRGPRIDHAETRDHNTNGHVDAKEPAQRDA